MDTLTEASIDALTSCPRLEKLHVATVAASGASMCRLFQSCSQLSDLSMNKASKATLSCLAHKCPKLTSLQLSGTDDDALPPLAWSSRLHTLHLSGPTSKATAGLLKVIKGCTRLRRLTVDTYSPVVISVARIYLHIPRHRHYQYALTQHRKSEDTGLRSSSGYVYDEEGRRLALKIWSIAATTGCTASLYLLGWSQRALCRLTSKLVELWPYMAQYISSKCSIVYVCIRYK